MSLKRHISILHACYTDDFNVDIDTFFSIWKVVSACQNESGKKSECTNPLSNMWLLCRKKEKKDSYLEIFCGYLYLTFAAAVSYKEDV